MPHRVAERALPDFERLVDPRFGVVLALHPKQLEVDEPSALVSFHGFVNNSRQLGQWYGDRISLGTSFNDGEAARRAAIDGIAVLETAVRSGRRSRSPNQRFDDADGESQNFILRPADATLDLSSDAAPTLSYLVIGIEHLVFGIDHVLFVIGLFLFIRDPWMLIKTITSFTVAHSITLALSVLDLVRLEQGPVEAIIALSIVFLARELLQEESKRSALTLTSPWVMAFIFGLLHGLGFAGALADIGLPDDAFWVALLLFNLGLEVGQLMVIAVMAALMWLLRRWQAHTTLTRGAAVAMGCLAAFWTIDRTLILI